MRAIEGLLPHLAVLPIVAPLLVGAVLLLLRRQAALTRVIAALSLLSLLSLLAMAVTLVGYTSGGAALAYALGNWPAPFGIALTVDRLTATMLTVTAVMGIACQLAAHERASSRFPALLQFQLAGLNGAFLTADLFNLFVFFEVLLAASYALLLDLQSPARLRAGLHYVTVNLLGSSLFLIAVAMFYAVAGTLNLADLDQRLATLPAADIGLAQVAGLLLLVVFAIKSAALPLGLWLPGTYGAAPAHVAVLFAIMTKVGIYSIARVHGTLFEAAPAGSSAGEPLAGLVLPWLLPAGLATLLLGAAGALGARDLRVLVAWLVIGSAGTLLTALGLGTVDAMAAAFYYLPHSTFAAGAAFIAVESIARSRAGSTAPVPEHYLVARTERVRGTPWVGALFFATALVIAGLPPGSGFVGKALLLDAAATTPTWAWAWTVVLIGSLGTLVALARTASAVFWKPMAMADALSQEPPAGRAPGVASEGAFTPAGGGLGAAATLLLACGLAMVVLARPTFDFLWRAARALGAS